MVYVLVFTEKTPRIKNYDYFTPYQDRADQFFHPQSFYHAHLPTGARVLGAPTLLAFAVWQSYF